MRLREVRALAQCNILLSLRDPDVRWRTSGPPRVELQYRVGWPRRTTCVWVAANAATRGSCFGAVQDPLVAARPRRAVAHVWATRVGGIGALDCDITWVAQTHN